MNLINSSLLIFVLTGLCACHHTENSGNDKTMKANTLSVEEKEAGWTLLFDGVTSGGWRGFKMDEFPDKGWHVVDGTLMIEYSGTGEQGFAGDIITKRQFENFDLKMDWKISPGGNSGIFFNVTESDDYKASWHTAHEIQVLDDFGYYDIHDYAPNVLQFSGALYDLYPPICSATSQVGEWNSARIRLEEGHLQHWINDIKVLDLQLWTDEWKKRVEKSKFNQYPDFGRSRKGSIGLQDHGQQVWYRNIRILEL